ncbi:phosphatidate cytidylyltransferase [Dichotomocladium elegans]|nr:phosphatidate cytidylyltransferase [Dichotomocladium elegans]
MQLLNGYVNPPHKDWFLFITCSLWILSESGLEQVHSMRMVALALYLFWLASMLHSWPTSDTLLLAQFAQFCWIHVAVFLTAIQMYFSISTIMRFGAEWFLLPTCLVIINDIAAYAVGRHVGRTPLYRLSPGKTVEGFVSAALLTMTASHHLTRCFPDHWRAQEAIVFGLYASGIAPMGGFLASAIKRSLKIKDFGTFIPGHGGIVDRMDCQLFIGVFTYLYLNL